MEILVASHIALGIGILSSDNTEPYTDNSGCVLVLVLALLLCLTPGTCPGTIYSIESTFLQLSRWLLTLLSCDCQHIRQVGWI